MARSSNPGRVLRSNGTTTEAVPLGPQMAVNGAAAAGEADSTATATMQRSSMPETTAEGGEYELSVETYFESYSLLFIALLVYVIYARRTDHEKESHLAWVSASVTNGVRDG